MHGRLWTALGEEFDTRKRQLLIEKIEQSLREEEKERERVKKEEVSEAEAVEVLHDDLKSVCIIPTLSRF